MASIEDRSKDLKKKDGFSFHIYAHGKINDKSRINGKKRRQEKTNAPFEITSIAVTLSPLLLPLRGVGRWEVEWDWD